MRNRRRWLWGLIAAIPITGVALAYLAPPFDEYASFDRIGTAVAVPNPDTASFQYLDKLEGQSFRKRCWDLTLSELDARRVVEHFASPTHSWQLQGSGTDSRSINGRKIDAVTMIYVNDDTGDNLDFSAETDKSGATKTVRLSITVAQEKSGRQWWRRLKHWAKLTLTP